MASKTKTPLRGIPLYGPINAVERNAHCLAQVAKAKTRTVAMRFKQNEGIGQDLHSPMAPLPKTRVNVLPRKERVAPCM